MFKYTDQQSMLILSYGAYALFWENNPEKLYYGIQAFLEKSTLKKTIVWGPAVSKGLIFTNALMYIIRDDDDPDDYTVVIRGTSPLSLATWVYQDVDVESQIPWNMIVKTNTLTDDIKISKGTANSILIHHTLVPEPGIPGAGLNFPDFVKQLISRQKKGETLVKFLKKVTSGKKKIKLTFTGHSLGGLMSSTLPLWLHDSYPELRNSIEMQIYSFAGLTAGNRAFAEHSDAVLGPRCRRYYNYLDLAVHAWNHESLKKFMTLYKKQLFLAWNRRRILKRTIRSMESLDYTQVATGIAIPATHFFKWNYIAEITYQHAIAYPLTILKGKQALKLLTNLLISSLVEAPGRLSKNVRKKILGRLNGISKRIKHHE